MIVIGSVKKAFGINFGAWEIRISREYQLAIETNPNNFWLPELEYSYSVLVLEYYSRTTFWVLILVFVPELFGIQKILVLVRSCIRYSFERAIEYTSTLPNGKASCRSALKCQSNFVQIIVSCQNTSQRQFVHRLLCKNKLLTFLLSNQCQLLLVSHRHTLLDARLRGAILPQIFSSIKTKKNSSLI